MSPDIAGQGFLGPKQSKPKPPDSSAGFPQLELRSPAPTTLEARGGVPVPRVEEDPPTAGAVVRGVDGRMVGAGRGPHVQPPVKHPVCAEGLARFLGDPDDPVFYSTCYRKVSSWKFTGNPACPRCGDGAADFGQQWRFGSKCISCADMVKYSSFLEHGGR